MTIYRVTRGTSYTKSAEEIFFTSRDKALGYIIGRYAEDGRTPVGRVRQADWWNASFCYNAEKLFDVKNLSKYNYLNMKYSGDYFYIDPIKVL